MQIRQADPDHSLSVIIERRYEPYAPYAPSSADLADLARRHPLGRCQRDLSEKDCTFLRAYFLRLGL